MTCKLSCIEEQSVRQWIEVNVRCELQLFLGCSHLRHAVRWSRRCRTDQVCAQSAQRASSAAMRVCSTVVLVLMLKRLTSNSKLFHPFGIKLYCSEGRGP